MKKKLGARIRQCQSRSLPQRKVMRFPRSLATLLEEYLPSPSVFNSICLVGGNMLFGIIWIGCLCVGAARLIRAGR